MGHHDLYGFSQATSVLDAFREIARTHVDQQGNYHGPDIPWQDSDITIVRKVVTRKNALNVLTEAFHSQYNPYRRPNVAIRVLKESDLVRRTVTIDLKGDADACDSYGSLKPEFITEQIASKVNLRAGEFIETHHIPTGGIQFTTKVVAQAPKEKAVTKYFVHLKGANPLGRGWDRGFDTQAQARAKALEYMDSREGQRPNAEVEVTPITRRESGAAMVTCKRVITKVTIRVEVSIVKPKPNAGTDSWAVCMDCHE